MNAVQVMQTIECLTYAEELTSKLCRDVNLPRPTITLGTKNEVGEKEIVLKMDDALNNQEHLKQLRLPLMLAQYAKFQKSDLTIENVFRMLTGKQLAAVKRSLFKPREFSISLLKCKCRTTVRRKTAGEHCCTKCGQMFTVVGTGKETPDAYVTKKDVWGILVKMNDGSGDTVQFSTIEEVKKYAEENNLNIYTN